VSFSHFKGPQQLTPGASHATSPEDPQRACDEHRPNLHTLEQQSQLSVQRSPMGEHPLIAWQVFLLLPGEYSHNFEQHASWLTQASPRSPQKNWPHLPVSFLQSSDIQQSMSSEHFSSELEHCASMHLFAKQYRSPQQDDFPLRSQVAPFSRQPKN
jgi:hypothetical protein